MNNKNKISKGAELHRYGDLVAIALKDQSGKYTGQTAYFDPATASQFADALNRIASDCLTTKFSQSPINNVMVTSNYNTGIYSEEVTDLIQRIHQSGRYTLNCVADEEERTNCKGLPARAVATILSLDSSYIYVTDSMTGERYWIHVILGNSMGELIADSSGAREFCEFLDCHTNHWQTKAENMPVKTA